MVSRGSSMLSMSNGWICKVLQQSSPVSVRRTASHTEPHSEKTTAAKKLALLATTFCILAMLLAAVPALAQDQSQPAGQTPAQTPAQAQPPDNGKPRQDVPAAAGGPGDNLGPYAIPKKTATEPPPPPPPPTPKKLEDVPDYSLSVNVPLVNVDVQVTT